MIFGRKIKHLFRTILGFILIPLAYGNVDTNLVQEQLNLYGVVSIEQKTIPIYCGDTISVFQALIKLSNEKPIAIGSVLTQGNPNNLPVAVLTFTFNEYKNTGTFIISIPSLEETCLIFYGVNWVFSRDLKRMILEMEMEEIIDKDKESVPKEDDVIKVIPKDTHTDMALYSMKN